MDDAFQSLWKQYPKKLGKKEAYRCFKSSVKNNKDFLRVEKALSNYLTYITTNAVEFQFIQHGKTWFNNWEDWEDFEVPKKKSRSDEEYEKTKEYLRSLGE